MDVEAASKIDALMCQLKVNMKGAYKLLFVIDLCATLLALCAISALAQPAGSRVGVEVQRRDNAKAIEGAAQAKGLIEDIIAFVHTYESTEMTTDCRTQYGVTDTTNGVVISVPAFVTVNSWPEPLGDFRITPSPFAST